MGNETKIFSFPEAGGFGGGNWFRKWLVDCDAKGEPVDWEDIL